MSWQRGYGESIIGSDARPVNRGRMVSVSQGELADLVDGAKRKANRAFKHALVIGAVLGLTVGVGATRAFGETISIGGIYINGYQGAGTTVTLEPSTKPGVLAVVTLDNRHVNQGADNGTYALTLDDLTVQVEFTWDADPILGSDRISVIPPLGVTCDPEDCGVTVMEGFTGTVTLFDWRGM